MATKKDPQYRDTQDNENYRGLFYLTKPWSILTSPDVTRCDKPTFFPIPVIPKLFLVVTHFSYIQGDHCCVCVARSTTILPSCIFTMCIRVRTRKLLQGSVVCNWGRIRCIGWRGKICMVKYV